MKVLKINIEDEYNVRVFFRERFFCIVFVIYNKVVCFLVYEKIYLEVIFCVIDIDMENF